MLTSYGLQDLRREQPAQLARASRGGTVEADAGRAALLQPDLHPVSPAGEQVRSELVQAGPVPDHGDGLHGRVGCQILRGLLRRKGGLEYWRCFGSGPGVQLGEYLRRLPRPLEGTAQDHAYRRREAGESAGSEPELFLSLGRERTPAVVGPAVGVAAEGRGVADEVEVQARLASGLFLHGLPELLPGLAALERPELFGSEEASPDLRRLAGVTLGYRA